MSLRNLLFAIVVLTCSYQVCLALSKEDKCSVVFNSFKEYPVKQLTDVFGRPDKTLVEGDQTIYVYGSNYQAYMPSSSYTSGNVDSFGNISANTFGSGGFYYQKYFWLKFFVDKSGKVADWTWRGNDHKTYLKKYSKRGYVNPQYVLDLPKKSYYRFGNVYVDHKKGLKLIAITPNSSAEEADLKKGDIIRSINGKDLSNTPFEFKSKLFDQTGDSVTYGVKRKGEIEDITLKKSYIPALAYLDKSERKFLGFSKDLDEALLQN